VAIPDSMPLKIPFRRRRPVVQKPFGQLEIAEDQAVRKPAVQPEDIRNLGELIKKRYELDIEIWGLRNVGPRDRPVVEDLMRRSDAILSKIRRTISAWDIPDAFETAEDWDKLKEIKRRIEAEGKRNWADHPPWIDGRRAGS